MALQTLVKIFVMLSCLSVSPLLRATQGPAIKGTLDQDLTSLIDSKCSHSFVETFSEDLQYLRTLKIQETQGSWFSWVFPQGIESMLSQRIQYVTCRDQEDFIARNRGAGLFLSSFLQGQKEFEFTFSGESQIANHPRVGLIEFGKGYSLYEHPLWRLGVLIHEARHSDCVETPTESDRTAFLQGQIPEDFTCGHIHDLCPEGHDYEGLWACDGHYWGAYFIEAVYHLQVHQSCANCDEYDRQLALVFAADRFTRVLDLQTIIGTDPTKVIPGLENQFKNSYGFPVMD